MSQSIKSTIITPSSHHVVPSQWIEIDERAFRHNISQIKQLVNDKKKIGLVIKSNAYGHGIREIATIAESIDAINTLLVACIEDVILLRSAGITKKIIIISAIRENIDIALTLHCSFMVTDFDTLKKINCIACALQKRAYVHIKIDSGLSRFGFTKNELPELLQQIKQMPYITIEGIYTHFAESNNADQQFTQRQAKLFETCVSEMLAAGFELPFIHHANSAASMLQSDTYTNFIRIGAAAYGLWPSEYVRISADHALSLRPILTWKSKIVHIKKITANSFVGYDRTYYTDKEMIIAIIPVGYYDGLDKRLSNKGYVKIGHQFAPIVGRVSMNVTTIDISHIDDVKLDDKVIMIGAEHKISAQAIAELTECNNPRQILTALSPLIRRIIFSEH